MNIVYCCYGGAHSSPVAAAVHLGRLDPARVPTGKELLAIDLFDKTHNSAFGELRHVGTDAEGNEIYVLAQGPGGQAMQRAVLSGVALGDAEGRVAIRFVDTLSCVNTWMRIGGFLSRGLGWVALGRPLVIYGTRRAYPKLAALAQRVRADGALRAAGERDPKMGQAAEEVGAGRRS